MPIMKRQEQEAPFGTPEIKIKKITGWKIAAVCVGIVLILVLGNFAAHWVDQYVGTCAGSSSCDLDCAANRRKSQAVRRI